MSSPSWCSGARATAAVVVVVSTGELTGRSPAFSPLDLHMGVVEAPLCNCNKNDGFCYNRPEALPPIRSWPTSCRSALSGMRADEAARVGEQTARSGADITRKACRDDPRQSVLGPE